MDLDSIGQDIQSCKKCPLYRGRINATPGEGSPTAEILFIGEGPGEPEDRAGRPFVGEAGEFLNELLASINLKREDVFITNVVKCRPPHDRDPLEEEVRICTNSYLISQIRTIKPKLIVTLGKHSMQVFFPQLKSVSDAHGKAYQKAGQVYLIMHQPAAATHQLSVREAMKEDFKKIPEILSQINQ
ncbi:MAG: uracil-DNA glycosylase [Candidatus Berkelbacteria bacterium]